MRIGRQRGWAVVALVLAACGGSSSTSSTTSSTTSTTITARVTTTTTTTTTSTTVRPRATTTTTTTTTLPAPGHIAATDTDNGKTITASPGSSIAVTLQTTSWSFSPTNPAIVAQQGATQTHPRTGCPPGVQCGTTSATFIAQAAGQADIVATRTYCGEAMQCTPQNDRWQLRVEVS